MISFYLLRRVYKYLQIRQYLLLQFLGERLTYRAKLMPVHIRVAYRNAYITESIISFILRTPYIAFLIPYLTLASFSIFISLVRISSLICDCLISGFAYLIVFRWSSNTKEVNIFSSSSQDKILLYTSTNLSSTALSSSQAQFQSRTSRSKEVRGTVLEVTILDTIGVSEVVNMVGEEIVILT